MFYIVLKAIIQCDHIVEFSFKGFKKIIRSNDFTLPDLQEDLKMCNCKEPYR